MAVTSSRLEMPPATFDLNTAASEFSTTLIKEKIQKLAHTYDEELEKSHVLQIRMLLRQVDEKRQAFNDVKESFVKDLRATLASLQVSSEKFNSIIAEIENIQSAWLSVIPAASTLGIRPPTSTTSIPVGIRGRILGLVSPLPKVAPLLSPEMTAATTTAPESSHQSGGHEAWWINSTPIQVAEESTKSDAAPTSRDLHDDNKKHNAESDFENHTAKRVKIKDNVESTIISEPTGRHKMKLANLRTKECIFKVGGIDKFYVIRCSLGTCIDTIFTANPFKYKRALNHFYANHFTELRSEAYIFECFSFEIEDASEESILRRGLTSDIPECNPSTALPSTKLRSMKYIVDYQSDEKSYLKEDGHTSSDDPVSGSEPAVDTTKPRWSLRRQPRVSYALMNLGNDAWNDTGDITSLSKILRKRRQSVNTELRLKAFKSGSKTSTLSNTQRATSERSEALK
ncbi:hypothetical protein BX600DRAFT_442338 [Xylariales sp. PMI_506]|nr:hypothetical protein BX600DRAFT_442338 [Xylariales sp. PMI_506]